MIDSAAETRPPESRVRALAASPAAAPVLVGGLMVIAFVARALLARSVLAPWEMPDELEYALISRSFASTGHYFFRDHEQHLRTIYPALISPAWWAGSVHTAYTLIKTINSGLMTLGAIPVYLWGRRLMTPLWAVVPVVLYLAMPGFMYTGEILTENAFVPAAVLAMFAIAAALERPTLLRQALALGAIVLASATRLQGLIFLIVLPTAILISLGLDAVATAPGGRRRAATVRLRSFLPTIAVLVVGLVAYAVLKLASSGSVSNGLGTYQQLSSTHYSLRPALRWIVFHFGELGFAVGVIPVAAFIVLFGLACCRATAPGPAERAFLAVGTASALWIIVQVGTFASHFSVRIEERYMFNLEPVFFIALAAWLACGLPRPPALTAVAVLVPVALLLTLPFESFFTLALFNDTYGLIPLWRLSGRLAGGVAETRALVGLGALVAGLLFVALPRSPARWVLPASVALFLILSSVSVFGQLKRLSTATRYAGGLTGNPSWIDDAVGRNARVELLDTADLADPHVLWQAEFWNRSVHRIFGLTAQDPSIPDLTAQIAPSGRVVPGVPPGSADYSPRYVASSGGLAIDGTKLASAGQLTLWRVNPPLRLRSVASGVTPDGWTGPTATYTQYTAPPGAHSLVVDLARTGLPGLPDARVDATVGNLKRTITVPGGGHAVLELPLRRLPFTLQLSVSPTFSPSQFGSPDTRTLGVQVSFSTR